MMNVVDFFVKIINQTRKQDASVKFWKNSRFKGMGGMSIDKRGETGEKFIYELCNALGLESVQDNRTGMHKDWDVQIIIDGKKIGIEIKTATMTVKSRRFQHENIPLRRNYELLCFLDIAPDSIYITFKTREELPDTSYSRREDGQVKMDFAESKVKPFKVTYLDDFRKLLNDAVARLKS